MKTRPFRMIDVFPSTTPQSGNPLAVVLDAEGHTTQQMAAFSAWTDLSQCTFVGSARPPRRVQETRPHPEPTQDRHPGLR